MGGQAQISGDRCSSPVWDVYDELRTARMNVKYYSARLARIEKQHLLVDLILAFTAPSSAVAALWFWDATIGDIVWKSMGAIAAFVAVAKPLIGLTKKIKAYAEVLSGYRSLEHDLFEIKVMISQKRAYDKELQAEFKKALKRKGVLNSKSPEVSEDKKLLRRCFEEVKNGFPENQFFVPEVK